MTKGETLIMWCDFPKMLWDFTPFCVGKSSILACLKVYLLDFHEFYGGIFGGVVRNVYFCTPFI